MIAMVAANETTTTSPPRLNIGSRFAIRILKGPKLMMKITSRFAAAICIGLFYLAGGSIANAGTLLPPGMQVFLDNNGLPLSSACVYFYIPNTTSPKDTYTSADQTTPNTNPVQLDAAGRAVIYGTGVYRQVVKASPCGVSGVTIWDQLTASTDSSVTIFAGASAGTPNAITVVAPEFTGADGQVINYISTNTNTGPATLNASGFGAVQIVRDSATGPGALTGGELVATNAVSVIYDATAGTFHILSPITWPNTAGVPVGAIIPFAGFTAPANSAFAYGQAVSRVTYASLFTAFTSTQNGSLTLGSPIITGLTDTTQFGRGQYVESLGIPGGATILSCTSSTCTLSANATTTRTGSITFFAYGNGDGVTTFNLPDYRGKGLAGRDNMGGTAANVSQVAATLTTTATSASATVSSATGLAIGMTLSGNANLSSGTTITAISGTTLTLSAVATGTQAGVATRFSVFPDAQALGNLGGTQTVTLLTTNLPAYTPSGTVAVTNGTLIMRSGGAVTTAGGAADFITSDGLVTITAAFTGVAQGGASIPLSNLPPMATINYAVRLTP